jgi:hypothetical protein
MLINLQVGQFQFFTPNAQSRDLAAAGTMQVVVLDIKFGMAAFTAVPPGAELNLQFQVRQSRILFQSVEAKAQRFGVEGRQLADANSDFAGLRTGPTGSFGSDRV